jgi:hypothetical protein
MIPLPVNAIITLVLTHYPDIHKVYNEFTKLCQPHQ